MKRIIACLLSAVLLLSGCQAKGKTEERKETATKEPLTLVLDWYPNAVHTFLYVAKEKGYFDEAGIDLKIEFPSESSDAIRMTAAGKVDLGIYYPSDILRARSNENIPIRSVGAITAHSMEVVIAKSDKNIHRPRDLVGKKIGYAGEELHEKKLRHLIERDGGDPSQTEFVDVGFDLMTAIITDQVDATGGNMVNHEVPAMKARGIDIDYFLPSEYGVGDYYELVFVTSDETIAQKKELLEKFFVACQKGFKDWSQNPDEGLNILMENQEASEFALDRDVEEQGMKWLLARMKDADHPFLYQDEKVWKDLIDFYLQIGILDTAKEPSTYYQNLLTP